MDKSANLKVLFFASEVAPFVKSGGLGDVAGSLPGELKKLGVDVRIVLPKYSLINNKFLNDIKYIGSFYTTLSWRTQKADVFIKDSELPIYFIENDYYFNREKIYGYDDDNERFAFFCKAGLDMISMIDFYPDIIHCNDWQTGPVSLFLKENYKKLVYYSKIKTLFTIHNLQYQGIFPKETMELLEAPDYCFTPKFLEFYGQVSYMKAGLVYSDMINTVSETYAREIQTKAYGYGLDGVLREREERLIGILNGIDYTINNPKTDKRIYKNFDSDSIEFKADNKRNLQEILGLPQRDVPLLSVVSRLADQKGIDLILQSADEILKNDVQLVILGNGEKRYEYMLSDLEKRYNDKVRVNTNFDDILAQKIYASSDIFLMPSLFEPCGLGQMFSLRYGAIPVVRKTGGLADTITHYDEKNKTGNGFIFENYDSSGLLWALKQAFKAYEKGNDVWKQLVRNAMNIDFSWKNSADKYIDLYKKILSKE